MFFCEIKHCYLFACLLRLARLACNGLTISDAELRPVGVGVFPVVAALNHSCDPNCVAIFSDEESRTKCFVR